MILPLKKGFTLIELLVSMAIIFILSGVMFSNYPDSSTRLDLADKTYRIAYLIKEAQIRGSAVDSQNKTVGGYGVYIPANNNKQLILFADRVITISPQTGIGIGDGVYNQSPADETATTISLPDKFSIKKICSWKNNISTCSQMPSNVFYTISFMRPSPQAILEVNNDGIYNDKFCIEIGTYKYPTVGYYRSIIIYNSGIVSTSKDLCIQP